MSIVARSLSGLSPYQIRRLREMIVAEENTWTIERELGVSKCVIGLLRANFPAFLRECEPRKSTLQLVYFKAKAA